MLRSKRILSINIIMLFVLFSFSSAYAMPKLFFEESAHNFGKIKQGSINKHTFKFENKGDTPIDIVEAKPTCGCTAALLTSQTIMPGDSGEMEITFNSGKFKNKVRKTVEVKFRDSIPGVDPKLIDEEKYPTKKFNLLLDAFVEYDDAKSRAIKLGRELAMKRSKEKQAGAQKSPAPAVSDHATHSAIVAEPVKLSFGSIKIGTDSKKSIKFFNNSTKPSSVEKIMLSAPYASAMIIKKDIKKNSAGEVRVIVHPKEQGAFSGSVSIYVLGSKDPIRVPIGWTAK